METLNSTREPEARRWLFSLLDTLSSAEFIQGAVTLWALWYARRQALHENIFQSPLSTHNIILKYIRELEECKPKRVHTGTVANQRHVPPTLDSSATWFC